MMFATLAGAVQSGEHIQETGESQGEDLVSLNIHEVLSDSASSSLTFFVK